MDVQVESQLTWQFTNDEDDLFEVLNKDLHRDDIGQTSLDRQMELEDDGEYGMHDILDRGSNNPRFEIGLPPPQDYAYGESRLD
jgi:hypothetical protein